jgi:hypothetical protein
MSGPAEGDTGRSSVERLLEKNLIDDSGLGKPLSRRAATTQRSVESYLKSGVRPRWMERVAEIDQGIAAERRRLERAYRTLLAESGSDRAGFARRWRDLVRAWRFPPELNDLIEQHNEWYPVEANLPMDPRTRDYQRIRGRSYRRDPVGADWVLREFPAE